MMPDRLLRAAPKLACPSCGEAESRTVRSSTTEAGDSIRRVRACLWCGRRYSTEERIAGDVKIGRPRKTRQM